MFGAEWKLGGTLGLFLKPAFSNFTSKEGQRMFHESGWTSPQGSPDCRETQTIYFLFHLRFSCRKIGHGPHVRELSEISVKLQYCISSDIAATTFFLNPKVHLLCSKRHKFCPCSGSSGKPRTPQTEFAEPTRNSCSKRCLERLRAELKVAGCWLGVFFFNPA